MMTVSLKLPEALLREVAAEAQRRGVSKSAIMRKHIEGGLRHTGRTAPASCADLAGGLVGSLRGPADLSTNPVYLDAAVRHDAQRGRKRHRRHR